MSGYAGGCTEARKLSGMPDDEPCCSSCHSDDEAGYSMCDATIDGKDYDVCCAVSAYVREHRPAPTPSTQGESNG